MSIPILLEAVEKIREDCPIPEGSRGYDFIDFPTGFAIQREGAVIHDPKCSSSQTGGAILCDCKAIYPRWREWKMMLAVADWLVEVYCATTGEWVDGYTSTGPVGASESSHAFTVARGYLGRDEY